MSQTIPLQKWLIRLGLGSKREVRLWIRDGHVLVNGQRCTRYAEPVQEDMNITVNGIPIGRPPEPVVWLMNKPKKHITGLVDPDGRPTLAPHLPMSLPRLFHVGRLDFNTEGALLWTNDGQLARRILHPDSHLEKVYHVKIRGHLSEDNPVWNKCLEGWIWETFIVAPAPSASCTIGLAPHGSKSS